MGKAAGCREEADDPQKVCAQSKTTVAVRMQVHDVPGHTCRAVYSVTKPLRHALLARQRCYGCAASQKPQA